MCISLKNDCETSRCLVGDMWSNDESDSVQDDASTHDQIESALRVRSASDG
jgi:hypothetical protein